MAQQLAALCARLPTDLHVHFPISLTITESTTPGAPVIAVPDGRSIMPLESSADAAWALAITGYERIAAVNATQPVGDEESGRQPRIVLDGRGDSDG
ncbi:hypothetical protein [Kitasatospora sp. NPDC057198]|uniref:hypothetical protein n=1 Tax=Kitasatospora sp. NPDC057198 TaxID=3346046 RepID=UPI003638483B